MRYAVHQIHLTRDDSDTLAALGWDKAIAANPRIASYADKEDVDVAREAWRRGHYDHAANIEATDLENVFHVGNVGPEENITRFGRMHSVSVGDIIVDPDGVRHLVAGIGFEVL